jgi:DNA-binding NarL/FixJ family response regulator
MAVLVIVDDLLFRVKIEAAAAHAQVALTVLSDAGAPPERSWRFVIVDLNLSSADPIDAVRRLRRAAPDVPIIGYCSHAQAALRARAHEAGCSEVLPRSAFVQRLPALLLAGGESDRGISRDAVE